MKFLVLDVKEAHKDNPDCPMRLAWHPNWQCWYCVDCEVAIPTLGVFEPPKIPDSVDFNYTIDGQSMGCRCDEPVCEICTDRSKLSPEDKAKVEEFRKWLEKSTHIPAEDRNLILRKLSVSCDCHGEERCESCDCESDEGSVFIPPGPKDVAKNVLLPVEEEQLLAEYQSMKDAIFEVLSAYNRWQNQLSSKRTVLEMIARHFAPWKQEHQEYVVKNKKPGQ
jgi:hypothetical protein